MSSNLPSISFVIATGGDNPLLQDVIDSIVSQNIPEYQIFVIGGSQPNFRVEKNMMFIPFDDSPYSHVQIYGHPGRPIPRKRNLGARLAKYDTLVTMHDYIKLAPNWYEEFVKFGTDWDICVHQCLNYLGGRSDGWRVDMYPGLPWACMVPYDMYDFAPYMAIQGNYHVVNRLKYLAEPLDDNLLWGQAEEMEWSRRIVPKSKVVCNPNCIVHYVRPREYDQRQCTQDIAEMNAHAHIFDMMRSCRIGDHKLAGER